MNSMKLSDIHINLKYCGKKTPYYRIRNVQNLQDYLVGKVIEWSSFDRKYPEWFRATELKFFQQTQLRGYHPRFVLLSCPEEIKFLSSLTEDARLSLLKKSYFV